MVFLTFTEKLSVGFHFPQIMVVLLMEIIIVLLMDEGELTNKNSNYKIKRSTDFSRPAHNWRKILLEKVKEKNSP